MPIKVDELPTSDWNSIVDNFSTTDWISIIVGIITFLGVGIAIYNIYQNTKTHKKSAHRRSVEVAVDLARHFQEYLLSRVIIIIRVYQLVGIKDLIGENIKEIKYEFTKQEAIKIFGRDKISEFIKLRKKIPNELRQNAAYIFSSHPDYAEIIKNPQDIERYFDKIRGEALNTLEWMAMLINTEAANSNVIYQSLHQLILRCIRCMYLDISYFNDADLECDKLYCSVIELYNSWSLTRNNKFICQKKKIQIKNDKIRKAINTPGAKDGTFVQRPKKVK